MQAVLHFLGDGQIPASGIDSFAPMAAILLSMLVAALASHHLLHRLSDGVLVGLQHVLCSRGTTLVSMLFVVSLVLVLTGTRGGLVLASASTLGLVPPLCGVRRINLMGCLLVPICATFLMG